MRFDVLTLFPAIFDGYLDGTLLTTLKEQTRKHLAENITGLSAEEAAVAAFLSLRLGELEKARNTRPARALKLADNPPRSAELLHN